MSDAVLEEPHTSTRTARLDAAASFGACDAWHKACCMCGREYVRYLGETLVIGEGIRVEVRTT